MDRNPRLYNKIKQDFFPPNLFNNVIFLMGTASVKDKQNKKLTVFRPKAVCNKVRTCPLYILLGQRV